MKSVLIVDDNETYLMTLVKLFLSNGFDVTYALDPVAGIEKAAVKSFDLVISDLVMDIFDGVRFVSTIKRMQPNIKSMILTAEPTSMTEISAIESNVDCYLGKDKPKDVLLKYVERLLNEPIKEKVLDTREQQLSSKAEGIVMLLNQRKVLKNNVEVSLSFKEFQLLKLFLENKGVALEREAIKKVLWTETVEIVDDRAVDMHIKKLRAKLKTFSIMSIRGYGYKWNEH